ncbi:MAG: hypothetical protein ACTSR8_07990 [Promethearchaeota archaeon]
MTQIIWTPLERVLWMLHISISLFGSVSYLKNAQRAENPNERRISLGFFLFMFLTSIGYIFIYLARFYQEGSFNGVAYVGTINDNLYPASIFIALGTSLYYLGMVIFIFAVESVKKQYKYTITILATFSFITTVIMRWLTPEISIIYTFAIGLLCLIFVFTFLYLTMSIPEVQNMTLFMLTGYIIIVIGAGFQLPESLETGLYPTELFPMLYIIGTIFMLLPLYIDADTFLKSKPVFFWGIFAVTATCMFSFALLFFFLTQIITYLIAIPGVFTLLLMIISLNLKSRRLRKENENLMREVKEDVNVLNVFARAKKMTEEEVSISKEKKIYLVCKGKVARYNIYICPECNSFYHQKCAKILESQENACWACEAPFNESIPVKLDKAEEENISIKDDIYENGKIK